MVGFHAYEFINAREMLVKKFGRITQATFN